MNIFNLKDINFKSDTYYFLLPYGLGDTMIMCGFKEVWEKANRAKIHFLIKPSHKIVMDMYKIKDYSLINFSCLDFFSLGEAVPLPTMGKCYVAHPEFHRELLYMFDEISTNMPSVKTSFLNWYKKFLSLPLDTEFKQPVWYPKISTVLENKLQKIAPIDKIVVLIPEANSIKINNKKFWKKIIKELPKDLIPITVVNNKKNTIKGIKNLELDLYDTVALLLKVNKSFILRNGLCDIIARKINKLTIIYDSIFTLEVYSLKNFNQNINEIVMPFNRSKGKVKIKLFGFLPLIKINIREYYTSFYLFYFIPLIKIKKERKL